MTLIRKSYISATLLACVLSFNVSAEEAEPRTMPSDNQPWSGYLGDASVYERMQEVEYKDDRTGYRWISSGFTFSKYQKLLVAPVVMYPKAEPTEQISEDVLREIQEYLTSGLKARIGEVFNVTNSTGAGVVTLEAAVTGISVSTEGMKVYEVMPVTAIFGGLKAITGTRDMDVHLYVESRLTDSETGELLGTAMRTVEGDDLKGKKDKLALEDLKERLDDLVESSMINTQSLAKSGEFESGKAVE